MRKNFTISIAVLGALLGLITFGFLLIAKAMVGGVETDKYLELTKAKDDIYRNIEISEEILQKLRDEKISLEATILEKINAKKDFESDLTKLTEKQSSLKTEISLLAINKERLTKEIDEFQKVEKFDRTEDSQNIVSNEKENIERIKVLELKNKNLSAKISQLIEVIEDESFLQSENHDRLKQQNASLQETLQVSEDKNSDLVKSLSLQEKQIQDLNLQAEEMKQLHREAVEDMKKENAIEISNLNISVKENSLKEIRELREVKTKFDQLNGLKVIFSGHLIYDEKSEQIVFRGDNAIGIPIFQDDFTGSIAGKCGLPIDEKTAKRCSATIIAEFVVAEKGLFLRGKEIVEIIRK